MSNCSCIQYTAQESCIQYTAKESCIQYTAQKSCIQYTAQKSCIQYTAQFLADLVTLTEKSLMENFIFCVAVVLENLHSTSHFFPFRFKYDFAVLKKWL